MSTLNQNTFFAIGCRGKIISFEFGLSDLMSSKLKKMGQKIEEDFDFLEPVLVSRQSYESSRSETKENVIKFYQAWYKKKYELDVKDDSLTSCNIITGFKIDNSTFVDFYISRIARFAYELPKLTADLILFVEDKDKRTFFVGIERKNNPGANMPASIGGFRDVNGYHFKTPAEALMQESEEEAGLSIIPISDVSKYENFRLPEVLQVKIRLGKEIKETKLRLVGTFIPGVEESIVDRKIMRVNETTAYATVFKSNHSLTENQIKFLLKKGSDAKEIFVKQIDYDINEKIKFGLSHHKTIFKEALKVCRRDLYGKVDSIL